MRLIVEIMSYVHQAAYVFIFGYSIFGPSVALMPLTGASALLIAGTIYLATDAHIEWQRIRPAMTVWLIAVYFLILAAFLLLASNEYAPLIGEAKAHYAKHGFAIIGLCLGQAIYEEVIFRRHLVGQFQRFMSLRKAIVASSVLFMLCHGSLSPLLFLGGVCFCLIAHSLQSFHAAIVIHAVYNIVGDASFSRAAKPVEIGTPLLLHGTTGLTMLAFTLLLFIYVGLCALVRGIVRRT